MVYPNDQNPKNLVLFYLPCVPKKLTFHCVFLCVSAKYLWPRKTIAPVVRVSRFLLLLLLLLLIQCKSGSLYFLHKSLNETAAQLRSMKSPGVEITAFFVCPTVGNRPTSER